MNNRLIRLLSVALAAALLIGGAALAEELSIEFDEFAEAVEDLQIAETAEEVVPEASDGPLQGLPDAPDPEPAVEQAQAAPTVRTNATGSEFVIEGGVLVAYNGNGGDVVIPGGVTEIGEAVFEGLDSVTHITLPSSARIIDEGAFCWCRNLEGVTIPDGLTTISNRAFEGCIGLKDLMIPSSVTTIAMGNFVYWDDDDDGLRILPRLTIIGYRGSCAEDFALNAYAKDDDFVPGSTRVIPFRALLDKAAVTAPDKTYTGSALKPAVTVKLGKASLVKGKDFKVSYTNNKKVGTATVTVKGINGYAGTAKGTFKVNPKPVTGLKLTAGRKQLTVKWKKDAGVTGYQLQYGRKKSFASATKVKVKKAATVKKVLKKLKSGKLYYVRIRAYKTAGKKTYWSEWSGAKKLKVK